MNYSRSILSIASILWVVLVIPLIVSCMEEGGAVLESESYNFSVTFPSDAGEIEKKTEEIKTSLGTMKMDFFLAYGDSRIYMVSALAHGLPDREEAIIWEGLDAAVKRVAGSGELLFHQSVRYKGHPAVSAKYKKLEGDTVFYGYLMVMDIDGVQYQLQVLSDSPEGLEEENTANFIYSFAYGGEGK
jgi:hypothetical protein